MITTPIRTTEEIEQMKAYFLSRNKYRDYTLFVTGNGAIFSIRTRTYTAGISKSMNKRQTNMQKSR